MNSESFGEYLRHLRKKNNLPLRIVASEIDIDQSTLSKIERSDKTAPLYIIKPLAKLYKEQYREFQIRYLSDRIYRNNKDFDYALESIEIATRRLRIEKKGTKINHQRQVLLQKITSYLSKSSVEKAWLFGSFARDEAKLDSDIDLLIKLKESAKIDLLDYIGISHDLEDLLGRNVDVVQYNMLAPEIQNAVDKEKVLIHG